VEEVEKIGPRESIRGGGEEGTSAAFFDLEARIWGDHALLTVKGAKTQKMEKEDTRNFGGKRSFRKKA